MSSFICPVVGCGNRPDPECVIEFTVSEVEGLVRMIICTDCHRKVGYGDIDKFSLSLSPTFVPVSPTLRKPTKERN